MMKRIVSGIFLLVALGVLGLIVAGALASGEQLIVRFLTAVIVAALGLYVISDLRLQADDNDAAAPRPAVASAGRSTSQAEPAPPNSTAAFMATVTGKRSGSTDLTSFEPAPTGTVPIIDIDPDGLDVSAPAPAVVHLESDGADDTDHGHDEPLGGSAYDDDAEEAASWPHNRPADDDRDDTADPRSTRTINLAEPSPSNRPDLAAPSTAGIAEASVPLVADRADDIPPVVVADVSTSDGPAVEFFGQVDDLLGDGGDLVSRSPVDPASPYDDVADPGAVAPTDADLDDEPEDHDAVATSTTSDDLTDDVTADDLTDDDLTDDDLTDDDLTDDLTDDVTADDVTTDDDHLADDENGDLPFIGDLLIGGATGDERDEEPDRVVEVGASEATPSISPAWPAPVVDQTVDDEAGRSRVSRLLPPPAAPMPSPGIEMPLAPIIDLRGDRPGHDPANIEAAIRSGELDVISSLIDQGLLSTEGPISDRDVRTMVFVAFSSNELRKILLAGGSVDGDNADLELGDVDVFWTRDSVPPGSAAALPSATATATAEEPDQSDESDDIEPPALHLDRMAL